MLDHLPGDVGLQSERAKVVAEKPAERELALFRIASNRMGEVGRAVGHQSELPLAKLLGRRQVDIDEIRVATVEGKWSWAWRDLRPVGDGIELDAIDDICSQVQAIAGIAQREALIE